MGDAVREGTAYPENQATRREIEVSRRILNCEGASGEGQGHGRGRGRARTLESGGYPLQPLDQRHLSRRRRSHGAGGLFSVCSAGVLRECDAGCEEAFVALPFGWEGAGAAGCCLCGVEVGEKVHWLVVRLWVGNLVVVGAPFQLCRVLQPPRCRDVTSLSVACCVQEQHSEQIWRREIPRNTEREWMQQAYSLFTVATQQHSCDEEGERGSREQGHPADNTQAQT